MDKTLKNTDFFHLYKGIVVQSFLFTEVLVSKSPVKQASWGQDSLFNGCHYDARSSVNSTIKTLYFLVRF